MYLRGIAIFCLTIVPTSFCYENIHDDGTFDRIQEAILTGVDTDQKYEIVPIELFGRSHDRSAFLPAGQKMQIRAFGEDIDLWLHPRDSIFAGEDTPVYHAKYAPDQPENVAFLLQEGLMRNLGQLLENPAERASVVIGTGEYGSPTFNGRIEKRGIVIRSLPQRVINEYVRRRHSSNGPNDSSNLNYHLVYKDNNERNNSPDRIKETLVRERVTPLSSEIPYILYPEILVVVEYSMYKALTIKNNINGALEYLLAFWNGVDLKYRALETPRVRFNIAGIVLAVDPWALSYITKNKPDDGKSLNVSQTIRSATNFFAGVRDSFPLNSYDVAVTMTTLVLGNNADERGLLGQAWPMSVCKTDSTSTITYAIAIIFDDNFFMGVHTAAHELGHSFGLWHDPRNEDCHFSNGFLMGETPWYTKNSTLLSKCSLKQFNERLTNGELKCLYNRPRRFGKQLPKLIPGKMTNLDEQCIARGKGVAACIPKTHRQDLDVCVNFWCRRENGECVESGIAAIEGTPCGDENEVISGFCLHNECVNLRKRRRNWST